MKAHTGDLWFQTKERRELVRITDEVVLPITGGKLDLGTWQQVFVKGLGA
jgi:thiamine phosphate synthase YjbQ (UPF0047 family)